MHLLLITDRQRFIKPLFQHRMGNQRTFSHRECSIQVQFVSFVWRTNRHRSHRLAVVAPTIDTATGLQLQPATAYTTLPAQYSIYTPTAIYSHLPATTLIPGTLASPGKEGKLERVDQTSLLIVIVCRSSITTILWT